MTFIVIKELSFNWLVLFECWILPIFPVVWLAVVLMLVAQPCDWRLTVLQIRNKLPLTWFYMRIATCHDCCCPTNTFLFSNHSVHYFTSLLVLSLSQPCWRCFTGISSLYTQDIWNIAWDQFLSHWNKHTSFCKLGSLIYNLNKVEINFCKDKTTVQMYSIILYINPACNKNLPPTTIIPMHPLHFQFAQWHSEQIRS